VLLRGERAGGLPAIQREQELHGHPLSGFGLSECTFHEPKEFRGSHVVDEILSIDSYRGITTRRLPAQVHIVHHLKWIAEYANAC
jgi:hypothetical protein